MADPSTKSPPADPDTPVLARQGLLPELQRRLHRMSRDDVAVPVTVGELRRLFSLPKWLHETLAPQLAVGAIRDALIGQDGLVGEFEEKLTGLPDHAAAPVTASELRPLLNLLEVFIDRLARIR